MSLAAMSLLESARREFFMNSTYVMSKVGIKRFCARDAELSLTAMSLLESARGKFFMNSTYTMSRKKESNVFVLRMPN